MVTLQVGKCLHGFRVSRFLGVEVSGYHGFGTKSKIISPQLEGLYMCISGDLYMAGSILNRKSKIINPPSESICVWPGLSTIS